MELAAIMRILKTIIPTVVSMLALTAVSHASISVSLDLEGLKASDGTALLPTKGVAVLVVSTGDTEFSTPAGGEIVPSGSDDRVVAMWDLANPPLGGDAYSLLKQSIEYGSDWTAGDPMGLFWFPEMAYNSGSPVISDTEAFGFYRDTNGERSGDSWLMPADGALLHSLKLFTEDADTMVAAGNGEVPTMVGYAVMVVGDSIVPVAVPASLAAAESTPGAISLSWTATGTDPKAGTIIERRIVGTSDWQVVGIAPAGATTYSDDTIGRAKEYEYRLFAANGISEVFSTALASGLTLRSNLVNIVTRGKLGADDQVLIIGFVAQGDGNINVLSRTLGPGAAPLDGYTLNADPTSELYVGGEFSVENDNWEDDGAAAAVTTAQTNTGVQAMAAASTDSAMALTDIPADVPYTIHSKGKGTDHGVALAELYHDFTGNVMDQGTRLVNVSTRGHIGTGTDTLSTSFTIEGLAPMKVLIRGGGPSLASNHPTLFEAGDVLSDPQLKLYNSDGVLEYENGNWANNTEIDELSEDVGAQSFASNSKDAALIVDLAPGVYTAEFSGVSDATGIGLIEIYEIAE